MSGLTTTSARSPKKAGDWVILKPCHGSRHERRLSGVQRTSWLLGSPQCEISIAHNHANGQISRFSTSCSAPEVPECLLQDATSLFQPTQTACGFSGLGRIECRQIILAIRPLLRLAYS